MGKVQRGRWSTKVNVLKQDRIIYDNEGYSVGFHDGRYKLGKYTVEGFSDDFYKSYEEGYNEAYKLYDKNGWEKGLDKKFNRPANNKNSGCMVIILFGVSVLLVNFFY